MKLGIILVISGLCVAAFTGALMKLLSEEMNAYQITWFRFLGLFLIMLPIAWKYLGTEVLRPPRPIVQGFRGITMSAATVFFIIGARSIDFADAIAILYAYPFLLTVLAVLFLKESVHFAGWIGVFGGFIGVLLVMRPGFHSINVGALFVFACAVVVSVQMVINRRLSTVSHPLTTNLYGAAAATISLSVIVPFYWQPVTLEQVGLLVLIAVTGAINQTCLVFAFAKAEASVLAPFTYLEIVAAVVFGMVIFGTLPDWISWWVIFLIVASGLLVLRAQPGKRVLGRNAKI